jgi:chromate reductase
MLYRSVALYNLLDKEFGWLSVIKEVFVFIYVVTALCFTVRYRIRFRSAGIYYLKIISYIYSKSKCMATKKKILAIIGSTRARSSNLFLVTEMIKASTDIFDISVYDSISKLPYFNPDLDTTSPPQEVAAFRKQIMEADGIFICTPEYVFSLPGSLKNAIEWCVSTTVFSKKPAGLITASASGEKAHEELQLVMQTVETLFTADTAWLIQGIKGKFNAEGILVHQETQSQMHAFIKAFNTLMER